MTITRGSGFQIEAAPAFGHNRQPGQYLGLRQRCREQKVGGLCRDPYRHFRIHLEAHHGGQNIRIEDEHLIESWRFADRLAGWQVEIRPAKGGEAGMDTLIKIARLRA
jgi:hypothetical protein